MKQQLKLMSAWHDILFGRYDDARESLSSAKKYVKNWVEENPDRQYPYFDVNVFEGMIQLNEGDFNSSLASFEKTTEKVGNGARSNRRKTAPNESLVPGSPDQVPFTSQHSFSLIGKQIAWIAIAESGRINNTYGSDVPAAPTDAGPEENAAIIIAIREGANSHVGTCSSSDALLTLKKRAVSPAANI